MTCVTARLAMPGARSFFSILLLLVALEQATEFILEYQLAHYLRLQGTAADFAGTAQRNAFRRVERGGLDLIFFFSSWCQV